AQLTSTRAGPWRSRAKARAASPLLASETSQRTALPPISLATASAAAMFTSSTATFAPARARWRAVSAPRPEPAPVTMAACPRTSMILSPSATRFCRRPRAGRPSLADGTAAGEAVRRQRTFSVAARQFAGPVERIAPEKQHGERGYCLRGERAEVLPAGLRRG